MLFADPDVQEYHPQVIEQKPTRFRDWFYPDDDNAIAIRTTDSRAPLTYRDLRDQCDNLPAMGVNERVALMFHRREAAELAVALIVLMNAGVAVCPLDATLSEHEMLRALDVLQFTTVITATCTNVSKVYAQRGIDVVVVQTSTSQCGILSWPTRHLNESERQSVLNGQWESTDAVLFLQTSGTTAQPKVVGLSTELLQHNASVLAASLCLAPSDVGLNVMPLFHIGGIMCSLLAALWVKSTVVMALHPFDPESFFAIIEGDLCPTWYYAAPTIHKALLLGATCTSVHSHLRFIRSGAGPLPHRDAVALSRLFRCTVVSSYSMTECMPICSTTILAKPDTVGLPVGPSLRIADTNGCALPYDKIGEVLIRGPGVMKGYEKESDDDFVEGWLRTGDRGWMDREGYVYLTGRSREMAKRGGEQISLYEVDEIVQKHPAVETCIAFPVPNAFWGEELAAAVVLRPPLTAQVKPAALISFIRDSGVAEHKIPAQIIVINSMAQLPQTATGKVIRFKIHSWLKVTEVDTRAVEAISGKNLRRIPAICKAIYGLRFLLALWVVQHHVGILPFKEWSRLQNCGFSVTGFTLIAGFSLASNVTSQIRYFEWVQFITSRVGAMHGLYLLALVYALPYYFIAYWEALDKFPLGTHFLSAILHISGAGILAPMLFGAPAVLGVTWYMCTIYFNVAFFPITDYVARRLRLALLQYVFLPLSVIVSCGIIPFITWADKERVMHWYVSPWMWTPCFTSGVLAYHVWRRSYDPQRGRVKWAIITDTTTLFLLVFLVLVASSDCLFETDGIFVDYPCAEDLHESNYTDYFQHDFHREVQHDHFRLGRWPSQLSRLAGFKRMNTPFFALWVYGLAHGRGYTASFLSHDIFVRYLAPLAYPLFLLHIPTSMYIYWLFHDEPGEEKRKWWWPHQGLYLIPVPWYSLGLTIVVAAVVGGALQRYCASPLIIYITQMFDTATMHCYCRWRKYEVGGKPTMFTQVKRCIRTLTGSDCSEDMELDCIGIDSFGVVALLSILRAKIPQARKLSPAHMYTLRTVGHLVRALETAADETERKLS